VVDGWRDLDAVLQQHCADRLDASLERRSSSGWAKTADAVSRISLANSGGTVDAMDMSDLLTLVLMLLGVLALLGWPSSGS
jgi:hypothetical protein